MRNKIFTTFTLMCAVFVLLAANAAKSQTPRFGSTRQVQGLLNRIESKTRGFRRDVEAADRNSVTITNREERFSNLMTDFESATQTFRSRFDSRQTVDAELTDLLNQASRINRFMERNPLNPRSQSE